MSSVWKRLLTETPDSAGRSGKQDSGGGVSPSTATFGLASAKAQRVGVFVAPLQDFGKVFCGGKIGKGDKICIASGCRVVAHNSTKCSFSGERDMTTPFAFIRVPTQPSQVYASSKAKVSELGVPLSTFSDDVKTVAHWQEFLQGLLQAPKDDKETVASRLRPTVQFGITPRRTTHRYDVEEVEPPGTPLGRQSSPLSLEEVSGLDATTDELDADDPMADIRSQWPLVTGSLRTITQQVAALSKSVASFRQASAADADATERQLNALTTVLGERPADMGVRTLWATVQDLTDFNVSEFRESLLQEVQEIFRASVTRDLGPAIDARIDEAVNPGRPLFDVFQPLGQLFANLTEHIPGDRALAPTHAGTEVAHQDTVNGLKRELDAMRADVRTLQDRLAHNADTGMGARYIPAVVVTVSRFSFTSESDVESWLKRHNVATLDAVANFMDAHLLLAVTCDQSVTSSTEHLQYTSLVIKSGYKSQAVVQLITSFQMELPAILGKQSPGEAVLDHKVLPAVRTFADWNPRTGTEGLEARINRYIETLDAALAQAIYSLPPDVRDVAAQMFAKSKEFITRLHSWMISTYDEFKGSNRATKETEVWKLVSRAVREIWATLHRERSAARTVVDSQAVDEVKAAFALWSMLKAYKKMQEYLDANFSAHPTIAPVLHRFLWDTYTPNSALAENSARLAAVEAEIKKVKAVADKAASGGAAKKGKKDKEEA